ncbi:phosphoribosyltransferase-like protein [Cladorrhinum sp. PSN259]|nr:phosphoribosyltransferase-like protein [Cladorrhinum sp. PSN259]
MCGVCGLLLGDAKAETAAVDIHESLCFLQHRGQDAAGITVFDEGKRVADLPGFMRIGHLRYPTAGTSSASEAQPLYANAPFGLSMSVNGNLVNTKEIRSLLGSRGSPPYLILTQTQNSYVLNVFAPGLNQFGKARANVDDVFTALKDVYARCHGAFACTAMIAGFGILGFRDFKGIRPLCLGSRPSVTLQGATDYFMAFESIALTQLGFNNIVDILPGQAVFIQKGGYVYFARPDSEIGGISVHRSRQNMGPKLAKKMKKTLGEKGIQEIDVIIPVPETSNTAAAVLAKCLDKPFSNAFVKNRYVYQTFILPAQTARKKGVRRKLSPIVSEFKGKTIVLVDDSIVQMAREAGAVRAIVASCSPEIIHPHIYGIDLADHAQLVAYNKTVSEIATHIQADTVIYQDLEDLKVACTEPTKRDIDVQDFEVGVFCGEYKGEVPEGFFERANQLQQQDHAAAKVSARKTCLVTNSGDVNVPKEDGTVVRTPENRGDIKCVVTSVQCK